MKISVRFKNGKLRTILNVILIRTEELKNGEWIIILCGNGNKTFYKSIEIKEIITQT